MDRESKYSFFFLATSKAYNRKRVKLAVPIKLMVSENNVVLYF